VRGVVGEAAVGAAGDCFVGVLVEGGPPEAGYKAPKGSACTAVSSHGGNVAGTDNGASKAGWNDLGAELAETGTMWFVVMIDYALIRFQSAGFPGLVVAFFDEVSFAKLSLGLESS
jgi:hypothetical protein